MAEFEPLPPLPTWGEVVAADRRRRDGDHDDHDDTPTAPLRIEPDDPPTVRDAKRVLYQYYEG